MERLERAARRLGRTPSETAALLLEESLREREFAFIEFRDSFVGRQAYIKGTRITVWQLVDIARSFGDVGETAANLEIPAVAVSAALAYAAAYPEEIESAIADNSPTIDELKRLIPNLHIRTVDASAP
jgi:uncharacterized protein (DUF433 family)